MNAKRFPGFRSVVVAILLCPLFAELKAQVVISEIVALNGLDGHLTEAGGVFDWIELHNQGAEDVDMAGYYLTDNPLHLQKWTFGDFVIPAGGHRVVFASERYFPEEPEVHLNFKLSSTYGEYLALVDPDGATMVSEFAPAFPPLFQYVAYGRVSGSDTLAILESATPNESNSGAAVLPEIVEFSSSAASIAGGEQVTLSWDTANATSVEILLDGGELVVESSGSVTLRPKENTQYSLVARNEYTEVRASVGVTVGAAVEGFTVTPMVLAPGGNTILRWELTGTDAVASLDGLSATTYSSPLLFTPSNEEVVPRDAAWKSVALFPGEGWQAVNFDDDGWTDTVAPLDGGVFFRTSFTLDNPEDLLAYRVRIPKGGEFGVWINGVKLADYRDFEFPVSARYEYPIDVKDLIVGENVLSFVNYSAPEPVEIKLTAWRPQPIDTVIPITLTSTNEVGESSMMVEVTVLAGDAVIPDPVPLSFTEFFWGYYGTYPTEPFRFFEIHNHGNEAIDLSAYQLGGSATFDFTTGVDPILEPDGYALVVADHIRFQEIWPGERPVLGVFEDPQHEGNYDWGFDVRLLDHYGRSLQRVSSSHLGVLGDLFVPPERVDVELPENELESWVLNYEFAGNIGAGGGTPGEGRLEIIDFSFSPPTANPGDVVTLNWELSREASLSISDVGIVEGRVGSVPFEVPINASFIEVTLAAETDFHVFRKTTSLTLPPRVTNVWTRTTAITPGELITVSWNSLYPWGFVNHRVDPEVGPIGGSRTVTFSPLVSGFHEGTQWRYFAKNGGPGADWATVDFSHDTWGGWSGVIGYGHPLVTRTLTPSEWVTAYFRKEFYVGGVEEVEALYLDILVDDGVEVHLNGVEILRDNLPEGPIDGNTPALAPSEDNGMSYRTFEIDPASLVEGFNVIAVGVHNVAADDVDLAFDMALRAQRPVPASGRKTYTLTSSNDAGSDEVQFTVLFDEPQTLADWMTEHGLMEAPESTDTDGDGLSDLLEYATGSDPNVWSPYPLTTSRNAEGELVLSHPLNLLAQTLRVSVEYSYDLATWAPVSARGSNYVFESALAPDDSPLAEVIYKSYGPAEEGARYYRLKVRLL